MRTGEIETCFVAQRSQPPDWGGTYSGRTGQCENRSGSGLSDILPEIDVVEGCRFSCDPTNISKMCTLCRDDYEKGVKLPVTRRRVKIVELPVGTTEDRVVGTLNIEKAITEGVKALEIGILAEANWGSSTS